MNEDIFQGYKGKALEVLKKYNVQVWDDADIELRAVIFQGKYFPVPRIPTVYISY